ncbi:MAG: PTS transporter subunit EIIB, partial [Lawsonibacter sp.]|nr:PTS transporter subunit EIIB [Lawsonibacter sp.]
LQGNAKTNWIWVPIVGVVYFVLYYFTFYFMITKMDLKTPGREDEGEETKLFTRSDFKAKTGVGPDGSSPAGGVSDAVSALILKGLGGKANLSDVDCCATRLRVTVIDADKVNDAMLKQSGASGVIHKGNGVQVVYGPQVAVIKSNLVDFIDSPESDRLDALSAPAPAAAPAKAAAKQKQDALMAAHMTGTVIPMAEVQDEAFSTCVLGEGVAIEPDQGKLYAPADGVVDNLFDTHHAIGLITDEGVELLLHIGINTVELGGKHFEAHVAVDQKVKKGDLLISFDMEAIKAAGYLLTTPMIVCNTDDYQSVTPQAEGKIKAGAPLLAVKG